MGEVMQTTLDFVTQIIRWLMAPLYIGLLGAILIVLLEFCRELVSIITHFPNTDASSAIVAVLRLISLVLVGQLASIMSLAGLRTLRPPAAEAGPAGVFQQSQTELADVRVRVISVMVAIGAVDLLEVLLGARTGVSAEDIFWKVIIMVTFVFVGVSLALTERIANGGKANST